jgi:hypothetical protein
MKRLFFILVLLALLIGPAAAATFSVSSYADLCKVGTGVDGWNLTDDYVQTADILCPGTNFTPIGNASNPFTGTYDGAGYEIRDLYIHTPAASYAALFSRVGAGADLQDIALVDAYVSGAGRIACLAAYVMGPATVENCTASGEIVATTHYAGGLVAQANTTVIINCDTDVQITLGTGVAGISNVGGLVGDLSGGSIHTCTASGDVVANYNQLGGLVGLTTGGSVLDSYATGTVYGNRNVGGLIGQVQASEAYPLVNITRCFATGDVTIENDYAGGLIGQVYGGSGYTLAITDCYASGDVAVTGAGVDEYARTGGLVGDLDHKVSVTNSYSVGHVSGIVTGHTGGLIGEVSAESAATRSYWDTATSGQATSAAGTGKTTTQMKALSTFSLWDIGEYNTYAGETWYIDSGNDYPRLSAEYQPPLLQNFTPGVTPPWPTVTPLPTEAYATPSVSNYSMSINWSTGYYTRYFWNTTPTFFEPVALVTAVFMPFTDVLGTAFWFMIWGVFLAAIMIRTGDVVMPAVIGILTGCMFAYVFDEALIQIAIIICVLLMAALLTRLFGGGDR